MSAITSNQPNLTLRHELRIVSTALTILEARSPVAKREGYAFESAMCQIESQSPLIRPLTDATASPTAEVASHRAHEMVTRVQLLTKFLEGVRGFFDEEDRLILHETAARIRGELFGAIGQSTRSRSMDPAKLVATDELTQARMLADITRIHVTSDRRLDIRWAA